jgi:hypothetical protein
MQYDGVIERALQDIQDLLWMVYPPPGIDLTDENAIDCLREIIVVPEVQRAIERGNDTAMSFVLRGVNRILSETELPPTAMLLLLWANMDDAKLNQSLGLKKNPRLMRKKPPAR